MSFVEDQVRRIDGQLDRLLLSSPSSPSFPTTPSTEDVSGDIYLTKTPTPSESPSTIQLQAVVKSLSTTSSSRTLLPSYAILSLLRQANISSDSSISEAKAAKLVGYDEQLQWLLLGKATTQIYGLILNTLLEQTIPLSNDIWYWDEVLSSYSYTALYSVQISPLRLWDWSYEVYHDAKRRLESLQTAGVRTNPAQVDAQSNQRTSLSLTTQWRQFYHLVQDSIRDRSMSDIRRRVVSPIALSRAEARKKQRGLQKLRELSASGLGVLMDEGLNFDIDDEHGVGVKGGRGNGAGDKDEWKTVVEKSVALMETVLRNVTVLETGVSDFEESVFASVDDDPEIVHEPSEDDFTDGPSRTTKLSNRLQLLLRVHLPEEHGKSRKLAKSYGRPSRVIRYWLPAVLLLVCSSTLLRVLLNRKAAVKQWIRELGVTVIDFWTNWVVEPTKKIIGTIRHDENAEVAIMSKGSLEGDRASLERMVVDFAVDNPTSGHGAPLSETEIADIRAKVREGDLTAVLRAYEKDLRHPFRGTVRGDLIRALLIQIQKTKVDVEVAMGGIDALLKSQELVFGFVGLTPGVLVCLGVVRWAGGLLGTRRGNKKGKKQGRMIRVLRSIDRILCASKSSNDGLLTYKEHGLLLCEVHVLRQCAVRVFPSEIHREFLEEVQDLVDIRTGVERQIKVVDRMRWAYARWMQ